MKFVCLDGSTVNQDISPRLYPAREISGPQTAGRERIKREYGDQTILEEFTIPKSRLRIDFFLPNLMVAIEVHGRQHFEFVKHFHGQHFEFVKHFHGTRKKFVQAQQRDLQKAKWCGLNGIQLVIWNDE
jgi:hypothetical protein